MLSIKTTNKFEKELRLAKKRGKQMSKLNEILDLLAQGKRLPPKNCNHPLKGVYQGYWECHIEPDWLLIYEKFLRHISCAIEQEPILICFKGTCLYGSSYLL